MKKIPCENAVALAEGYQDSVVASRSWYRTWVQVNVVRRDESLLVFPRHLADHWCEQQAKGMPISAAELSSQSWLDSYEYS